MKGRMMMEKMMAAIAASTMLWLCLACVASAQAPASGDAGPDISRYDTTSNASRVAGDTSANRTTIDEDYDLDIDQKKIDLGRLESSASVELHDGERLSLSVGVGIAAEDVDITLREVHGHVTFHATLARLLESISRLRARVSNQAPR